MSERRLRVAVAGATGAVGTELVSLLSERSFPLAEIYPFATERSLGRDIELLDEVVAVETALPRLQGYDLLFICTPRDAALDLVREALRAEVSCIDCSGALLGSSDVPMALAELSPAQELLGAPVVSSPPGPALAWCRALAALDALAPIERVVGTVLQSASHAGGRGIDTLSGETIALLRQEDPPPHDVFPAPIAFDCLPRREGATDERAGADEAELAAAVCRILGREVGVASSWVQVPAFVGEGDTLCVEFARAVDADDAYTALDKALGVSCWSAGLGPSTRDAAGGDEVLVGGLRVDPSRANALLLWLASDPVRLAALNAVKLAEARLRLH